MLLWLVRVVRTSLDIGCGGGVVRAPVPSPDTAATWVLQPPASSLSVCSSNLR